MNDASELSEPRFAHGIGANCRELLSSTACCVTKDADAHSGSSRPRVCNLDADSPGHDR
jgi:hypothetical protein